MSASMARARSGFGTRFQMGDGLPTAPVVVATGGAAIGATTVPVTATTVALASGTILIFGIGKSAELTAAAIVGAASLVVKPLAAALIAGDTALGGENFATIAEVSDITPPSPTTSTFETTHHLSPGGVMQFAGGLTDSGDMSITFNWLPGDPTQDGVTGLRKAFKDKVLRNFRVIYPFSPAVVDSFAGLVTTSPVVTPINDRMTSSVTVKCSGDIIRT